MQYHINHRALHGPFEEAVLHQSRVPDNGAFPCLNGAVFVTRWAGAPEYINEHQWAIFILE